MAQRFPITHQVIKDAKMDAEAILWERGSSSVRGNGSTTQIVHHYDHGGWGCGWHYGNPCYVSCPSNFSSNSRDKSKSNYLQVVIPAIVIGLGACYFAGQSYAKWSKASSSIQAMNQNERAVASELCSQVDLKQQVGEVIVKYKDLIHYQHDEVKKDLALRGSLIGFAILGITGAVVGGGSLVAIAAGGGIASGAAMLWRAGVNSSSTTLTEKAKHLQDAAKIAEDTLDLSK